MPKVNVGDINMYYEVHGEGEPLLLITGLGRDLTIWILQTREFSKKYQLMVFDNRGVGRTDAPDVPYSYKMMADDTAGLLDALGIEKAHVLGLSMGGIIAQEFTLKYPQRVKSLVLAATTARPYAWAAHILVTRLKLAQEGVKQETIINFMLPFLFTDKFFENPEMVQMTVNNMLANPYRSPADAFARQFFAGRGYDTRERLGQITAPTLVIVGKEDILLPVKLSKELAEGIPNAELVILEEGGHGFFIEIADKFNKAVLEFLAKVESRFFKV